MATEQAFFESGLCGNLQGQDSDPNLGIDTGMLLFFRAHGTPDNWDLRDGRKGFPECMLLGNSNDSRHRLSMRYYWQCSCRVFAHGPCQQDPSFGSGKPTKYACKSDPSFTFQAPAKFVGDPSSDTVLMRSVFARWGKALGPDFRMACSGSSDLLCRQGEARRIWQAYREAGLDVADSFLVGLHQRGAIPLCLAKGGDEPEHSPLYDRAFDPRPNPFEPRHYAIEYTEDFSVPMEPGCGEEGFSKLMTLPVFGSYDSGSPLLKGLRYVRKSGAFSPRLFDRSISGTESFSVGTLGKADQWPFPESSVYIAAANQFIQERGWSEQDMSLKPEGFRLLIDRSPIGGDGVRALGPIDKLQKGVVVVVRRVDATGCLSLDSRMLIQLSNEGQVVRALKIWPERSVLLRPKRREVNVAVEEARLSLRASGKPDYVIEGETTEIVYRVVQYDKGAMEVPFYRLRFLPPLDERGVREPEVIEVPAFQGM